MRISAKGFSCFLANVLIACALLVFAAGFFPHKAFLPGLAQWPSGTEVPFVSSPFDKVIFMVIDALRRCNKCLSILSASAYNTTVISSMPQRQISNSPKGGLEQLISKLQLIDNFSLIRSGAAVPFTGHASPPTITMPRVKAITTGSVPSFLDVVLNFAESDTTSTLASQDSWLAQIRSLEQGKLLMYGDDTWLKLFPGFFERADGTTSFFVSVGTQSLKRAPSPFLTSFTGFCRG